MNQKEKGQSTIQISKKRVLINRKRDKIYRKGSTNKQLSNNIAFVLASPFLAIYPIGRK